MSTTSSRVMTHHSARATIQPTDISTQVIITLQDEAGLEGGTPWLFKRQETDRYTSYTPCHPVQRSTMSDIESVQPPTVAESFFTPTFRDDVERDNDIPTQDPNGWVLHHLEEWPVAGRPREEGTATPVEVVLARTRVTGASRLAQTLGDMVSSGVTAVAPLFLPGLSSGD
jgi:hypothetical protein